MGLSQQHHVRKRRFYGRGHISKPYIFEPWPLQLSFRISKLTIGIRFEWKLKRLLEFIFRRY